MHSQMIRHSQIHFKIMCLVNLIQLKTILVTYLDVEFGSYSVLRLTTSGSSFLALQVLAHDPYIINDESSCESESNPSLIFSVLSEYLSSFLLIVKNVLVDLGTFIWSVFNYIFQSFEPSSIIANKNQTNILPSSKHKSRSRKALLNRSGRP